MCFAYPRPPIQFPSPYGMVPWSGAVLVTTAEFTPSPMSHHWIISSGTKYLQTVYLQRRNFHPKAKKNPSNTPCEMGNHWCTILVDPGSLYNGNWLQSIDRMSTGGWGICRQLAAQKQKFQSMLWTTSRARAHVAHVPGYWGYKTGVRPSQEHGPALWC